MRMETEYWKADLREVWGGKGDCGVRIWRHREEDERKVKEDVKG